MPGTTIKTRTSGIMVPSFVAAVSGGGAAVSFDASAPINVSGGGITTFDSTNLTIGASANCLVVGVAINDGFALNTVTWDSGGTNQAMTFLTGNEALAGTSARGELWGLLSPTVGNKTLRVTSTSATRFYVGQASFRNVTSFLNQVSTNAGGGGAASLSVNINSAANHMVVGWATDRGSASGTMTMNLTQISTDVSGNIYAGMNRGTGAATVTVTVTPDAVDNLAAMGVDLSN